MSKVKDLGEFFSDIETEFLKFERIADPRSRRRDLHAFMLLDELIPGSTVIIISADHDKIWLSIEVPTLLAVASIEQLIDLHRCGVFYHEEALCMYS